MFLHRCIPTVFIFTLACMPAIALGEDVASLKAAFEKEIAALNASDLETVMAMQHEQVVAINPRSPQAIDTKAARREGYQQLFEATETFTVTPQNPEFRVVGDAGIVWGTYGIVNKPKAGEEVTFPIRFSRTYVKNNGAWQLFLYHVSAVPGGE